MRTLYIQQNLARQLSPCADSQDQHNEEDAQLAQVGRVGDIVKSMRRVVAW
jgi:hypothetical protein